MRLSDNPKTSRLIIFSLLLTLTAFAVTTNAIPPLSTTIAEAVEINYQTFARVYMVQFLSFAFGCLFGSYLIKHTGLDERKLILLGLLGSSLTLVAISQLRGFWPFVVLAMPLGFFGGWIETFGAIMISGYDKPNSSKYMNLSQVFFCIGAVSAPQIAGALLLLGISWRTALLIFAGGIFLTLVIFRSQTKGKLKQDDASANLTSNLDKPETFSAKAGCVSLYLLILFMFLYVCIETSIICWAAPYFEFRFNVSAGLAAFCIAIFWMGVIAGRMAVFVLPVRFTLWPVVITGAAAMVLANFALSMANSPGLAVAMLILSGIAHGPIWPTTVALSMSVDGRVMAVSVIIAAGAIGAALGPIMSSFVTGKFGNENVFVVLALASVILLCVVLLAWAFKKRKLEESAELL